MRSSLYARALPVRSVRTLKTVFWKTALKAVAIRTNKVILMFLN